MTTHLIARDVAIAALAAYDRKGLSAQGPTPACAYRDGSGLPCAIGVALTDEQAKDAYGTVHTLSHNGIITSDDLTVLDKLQIAHDRWASNAQINSAEEADLEAAFLELARELAR